MNQRKSIVIGSRSSKLAVYQAVKVKSEIEKLHNGLNIEIKTIRTFGDKIIDKPLSDIGGKGIFTKEIEEYLLRGEVDIAVHSLKDLPTELTDGLRVSGVLQRDFPEDVLIAREKGVGIADIKNGGIIATGSLRRRAQLLHLRRDLEIKDLRGNVETRIKKFTESNWEGIILARAGVERLGLSDNISSVIPTEQMLPAVCQGIIGVEINLNNQIAVELVESINHQDTWIVATAERSFMRAMGGGCSNPVGASCVLEGNKLRMEGMIASIDGEKLYRDTIVGEHYESAELGVRLAEIMMKSGGGELIIKFEE